MGLEIEHKFLVVNEDWKSQQAGPACRYTQGYLAFGDDTAPEIRVRLMTPVEDDSAMRREAVLTVKSKGDLVRQEIETVIDADAAQELLSACQGAIITKVRHRVREANGFQFEVDVYDGDLAGLVVAEIEVPSVDTAFDSQASFLGENITKNKAYKNAALARDGSPVVPSRPRGPGR